MLELLDALVIHLEGWIKERNWTAMGDSDAVLRELVGQAVDDKSIDASQLEQRLTRLKLLYLQAVGLVEEEKASSGQEMAAARKSLKAARSYLSNS